MSNKIFGIHIGGKIQQNQSFDEMPTACICDLLLATEFRRTKGKIQGISKLRYVGSDIASRPVWTDYINSLKSLTAQNSQEESQRMIDVRKVYQKAIVSLTHHVEQHWRDYKNFENSLSRALAKGLLSEYQPKYNSARAVYRQRTKYVDEIDWIFVAIPPSGRTTMDSMEEILGIRKV
ncbi:hypothetical protein L2E82_40599 [Cichorium intybus]|uniref:Uncharacterized protein n=1 Tax=Cichorium intybus TaxID=13427 RepID=A0ACB9AMD4_CICIN|nr:hypothetical protein L2E82_40599 [Cichorium intybus]